MLNLDNFHVYLSLTKMQILQLLEPY